MDVVAVALFALLVGGLLNRAIDRLRFEKSLVWPLLPHCETCYQPQSFVDSFPVLGAIIRKGRCRVCGARASHREIVVPVLCCALVAGIYILHVVGRGHYLPKIAVPWHYDEARLFAIFVYYSILACLLIVATFIDLDLMIIPDSVTVTGMFIGLVLGTFWYLELHPVSFWTPLPTERDLATSRIWRSISPTPFSAAILTFIHSKHWEMNWNHYIGLINSLLGLIIGGGIIWNVRIVCSKAFGREAMGFGDVTLMAMIGSFLGWQGVLFAFILSVPSAMIIGIGGWILTRSNALPFGPHLAIGAVLTIFGFRYLWQWAYPVLAFSPEFLALAAIAMTVLLALTAMLIQAVKWLFGGRLAAA